MTLSVTKKKLLGLVLAIVALFSVTIGTTNAYALTLVEQSGLNLAEGQSSATTSRVTVTSGQQLHIGIYYYYNSPNKATTYKIFKNGVEWYNGSISGTARSVEKSFTPGAGEYSLRHYNSSGKEVSSYGGIQVYKP